MDKEQLEQEYRQCIEAFAEELIEKGTIHDDLWHKILALHSQRKYTELSEIGSEFTETSISELIDLKKILSWLSMHLLKRLLHAQIILSYIIANTEFSVIPKLFSTILFHVFFFIQACISYNLSCYLTF